VEGTTRENRNIVTTLRERKRSSKRGMVGYRMCAAGEEAAGRMRDKEKWGGEGLSRVDEIQNRHEGGGKVNTAPTGIRPTSGSSWRWGKEIRNPREGKSQDRRAGVNNKTTKKKKTLEMRCETESGEDAGKKRASSGSVAGSLQLRRSFIR